MTFNPERPFLGPFPDVQYHFLLWDSLLLSIAQALLWLKIGPKPSHDAQSTLACSFHFLGSLSSSAKLNPLSTGGLMCLGGLSPTVCGKRVSSWGAWSTKPILDSPCRQLSAHTAPTLPFKQSHHSPSLSSSVISVGRHKLLVEGLGPVFSRCYLNYPHHNYDRRCYSGSRLTDKESSLPEGWTSKDPVSTGQSPSMTPASLLSLSLGSLAVSSPGAAVHCPALKTLTRPSTPASPLRSLPAFLSAQL